MFITDDRIWATGRKAGGYWGSASLAWRFEQAVISATASAAAVTPADQGRHPAAALGCDRRHKVCKAACGRRRVPESGSSARSPRRVRRE